MIDIRLELAGDERSVFGTKAETKKGAGVTEDGVANVGMQLMEVACPTSRYQDLS